MEFCFIFPLSTRLPLKKPKDLIWRAINFKNNISISQWYCLLVHRDASLNLNFTIILSRIVNESRQVLQEPDFAQSLLRDPNTPIIRKSRGTSTQGTSTHASSTQLAMVDDQRSKAGSVHSKVSSYHGSLHRSRDGR